MSELMAMPTGFRFEPTDEELISSYLLRKVMGLPLSWNGILEKELYGENTAPWDVFKDIDESSCYWHVKKDDEKIKGTKKIIYVFTKLVKVGPNSKRIARKAGCGTWDGQTGPRKIKSSSSGDIIGSTRMLTFQHAKRAGPGSGLLGSFAHWIMHEYSLDGVLLNHQGLINNDLVLCKITRCLRDGCASIAPQFSLRDCFSSSCINGIGGIQNLQLPNNENNGASTEGVEECDGINLYDQKKPRSSYDHNYGDIDQLLAGLESIKNWNIDALFQGLDGLP